MYIKQFGVATLAAAALITQEVEIIKHKHQNEDEHRESIYPIQECYSGILVYGVMELGSGFNSLRNQNHLIRAFWNKNIVKI